MMEEEAKRRLKAAELQAKKTRLRIWTNYVPPTSNSKAIVNQNFTGKVLIGCSYFVQCYLIYVFVCVYTHICYGYLLFTSTFFRLLRL